ncbi:MAG: Cysteine proteinase [Aureobasidium pullulans]|nr:MAG: Cysteine proteinase [Aureobasidium pullulans]
MSTQNSPSPPPAPSQSSSSSIPNSIPTLRPKNQKPNFARPATSDLQSRLQTFLPQMAAANAELEKLAQEGGLEGKRLEDVGEGDEYVEMELGLGVMEEKKEGDESSDESSDETSDDSSEDSSEDDDEEDKAQKKKQKEKEQKEKDILGRLMGHKQGREKAAGIQEVE